MTAARSAAPQHQRDPTQAHHHCRSCTDTPLSVAHHTASPLFSVCCLSFGRRSTAVHRHTVRYTAPPQHACRRSPLIATCTRPKSAAAASQRRHCTDSHPSVAHRTMHSLHPWTHSLAPLAAHTPLHPLLTDTPAAPRRTVARRLPPLQHTHRCMLSMPLPLTAVLFHHPRALRAARCFIVHRLLTY